MDEEKSEKIISPCINECVVSQKGYLKGYCTGCLRSIQEIAAWAGMTDEERQQVMVKLANRKEALLRFENNQ